MRHKQFTHGNVIIPVDITPYGMVNIGATGTISIADFARLAASVLCESNNYTNAWEGFPVCNNLEDR